MPGEIGLPAKFTNKLCTYIYRVHFLLQSVKSDVAIDLGEAAGREESRLVWDAAALDWS